MLTSRVLPYIQSLLSRSELAVRGAVKLRNQCDAVIARRHGATNTDPSKNGEELAIRHLSPHIRRFVDVGANRGQWTDMVLRLASSAERGLLFDPSESAYSLLSKRFASNPIIEIVNMAVGDKTGTAAFFEESDAGETASLVEQTNLSVPATARSVPITTLDCEIERVGWESIDYLKIDAEGFDFHVLQGAKALFTSGRVLFGQFEYGPGWRYSGSTVTYAIRWLSALNYDTFLLRGSSIAVPEPDFFGEYFQYSNYLFARRDLVPVIKPMAKRSRPYRTPVQVQ